MALVSTETKGHRYAGDANRRAMEQKRSVRRATDKHCIALARRSTQKQGAEWLKSAHRTQKEGRR